ncbi:hypothetical protein FS842_000638 [Serendipita sp. 407]|nr:hypothetical protein FS842_000638 [Serendipita sp. 407]
MAAHFASLFQDLHIPNGQLYDPTYFENIIPRKAERWLKVRIGTGGDLAHGADIIRPTKISRDATFYHMMIDTAPTVRYGQLQSVYKLSLPPLGNQDSTTYLLTFIIPCSTGGSNATIQITYYSQMERLGISDLTCLVCTIRRVPMGDGRFGIIGRSTEGWPTIFEEFPLETVQQEEGEGV